MRFTRATASRVVNLVLRPLGVRLGRLPREGTWAHPATPSIAHETIATAATYAPWRSDGAFQSVYATAAPNTLVDEYRCYALWALARQMAPVPGDFLEIGVWKGGTGLILASAAATLGRRVYLADTFQGVVKAGPFDTHYVGGEHAETSASSVRNLLTENSIENAIIIEGTFPDQTGDRVEGGIAFAHIDVDVYASARDAFEWLVPRLPVGGIAVFDDYGFHGCEGVTRLVNELRAQRVDFLFVHNLNGQAVAVKRG